MFRLRKCHWMALSLLTAVTLAGCGSGVKLGKVEGTVTLDGKPLSNARVSFRPKEGGRTAEAVTDDKGHYVLEFAAGEQGALLGPHVVRISTYEEPVTQDDGRKSGGRPELVPAKFNTNSELIREVAGGKQTFDFDLSTK